MSDTQSSPATDALIEMLLPHVKAAYAQGYDDALVAIKEALARFSNLSPSLVVDLARATSREGDRASGIPPFWTADGK